MPKGAAITHEHKPSYTKRRTPDTKTKRFLLSVQKDKCFYCGLQFNEWYHDGEFARVRKVCWDHVSPYSFTFNSDNQNFVASCARCNGVKSNKVFDSLEAAAEHVRSRLKAKGYETAPLWGNKQIRKLVVEKAFAENSTSYFSVHPDDFESLSVDELKQKLKEVRTLQALLKSYPKSQAELKAERLAYIASRHRRLAGEIA